MNRFLVAIVAGAAFCGSVHAGPKLDALKKVEALQAAATMIFFMAKDNYLSWKMGGLWHSNMDNVVDYMDIWFPNKFPEMAGVRNEVLKAILDPSLKSADQALAVLNDIYKPVFGKLAAKNKHNFYHAMGAGTSSAKLPSELTPDTLRKPIIVTPTST